MQKFQWPKGTQAELQVYPADHPQRKPTEEYFADEVRRNINDVRSGRDYINLWLLIDSLKNLSDNQVSAGFHTWLWAIEGVLGTDGCQAVGKRVCEEMSFTIEEGERLREEYRLKETASWDQINKRRNQRRIPY